MKFCLFVANLHIFTNFGKCFLIFNEIELIFLGVFMAFTALPGMQTRSSDENSICLSVCLSVCQMHDL